MKVGVVGVGWAGQQHIKAYAAMDDRRAIKSLVRIA